VVDLKELDRYSYSGHSTLIGKKKRDESFCLSADCPAGRGKGKNDGNILKIRNVRDYFFQSVCEPTGLERN